MNSLKATLFSTCFLTVYRYQLWKIRNKLHDFAIMIACKLKFDFDYLAGKRNFLRDCSHLYIDGSGEDEQKVVRLLSFCLSRWKISCHTYLLKRMLI